MASDFQREVAEALEMVRLGQFATLLRVWNDLAEARTRGRVWNVIKAVRPQVPPDRRDRFQTCVTSFAEGRSGTAATSSSASPLTTRPFAGLST